MWSEQQQQQQNIDDEMIFAYYEHTKRIQMNVIKCGRAPLPQNPKYRVSIKSSLKAEIYFFWDECMYW